MEGTAGPRQLRRLLEAVLTIGADLDLDTVLRRIAEAATDLVDASYGALGVLDESRESLREFITVGIDDDTRRAIGEPPKGHGLLGALILDPVPRRLPDLAEHPDSYGFPPNHPPMTSFLGVPIFIRGQAFGNLYLCDKADGDAFSDIDEELVVALAAAAGVAIENARLHGRVAELALFEDRERIARDLHDTVIQRLFAVGLSLQGTIRLAALPVVVERIESAVEDLDVTVKEIRSAIFELHSPHVSGRSIRQATLDLVAEAARPLGFEPSVRFDGPVDTAVDESLADEVLAVQREALANVAKHAGASSVALTLSASEGVVTIEVRDDGQGFDAARHAAAGRGLENLAERAHRFGGAFDIRSSAGDGTVLHWTVPIAK